MVIYVVLGHGLSYTTFRYSGLSVDERTRTISFYLTNTGKLSGAEVAQLYLSYPDKTEYPFKQLRGFEKVTLTSGARKMISFTMSERWLSSWDVASHAFKVNHGKFGLSIGGASDDIQLTGNLNV